MSSATTSICRSLMLEIERWRIAMGLPMDKFSEYAGLPDRYYSKALHSDAPSGRQPRWASVQIMVEALFPQGFDLEIRPKEGAVMTADSLKAKLLQLRAPTDVKTQRELMRELGRKGAIASATVRRDKAAQRRMFREHGKRGGAIRWRNRENIDMAEVCADLRGESKPRLRTKRAEPSV